MLYAKTKAALNNFPSLRFQVHDELVLQVPEASVTAVALEVQRLMVQAAALRYVCLYFGAHTRTHPCCPTGKCPGACSCESGPEPAGHGTATFGLIRDVKMNDKKTIFCFARFGD